MVARTRSLVAVVVAGVLVLVAGLTLWWILSTPTEERPPEAGPDKDALLVRVAAAGDTGTGDEAQYDVVRAMSEVSQDRPFDAVVLLGDIVYDVGDPDLVRRTVKRPYAPLVEEGAELIPALGNHDVISDESDEILERLGRDDPYYVDRVGPVRFVVLDSNAVDDTQTQWLQETLADDPAGVRWTIAAMHHPPYSAGEHGSKMSVREEWTPLFEEYDVELVLSGHDHDYQRSEEINGVTYVVSGGGGAELRPVGDDGFTAFSESVLHFLDIAVYRDRIDVRAIDPAGDVVDSFSVR